jgi:hypothetical protein
MDAGGEGLAGLQVPAVMVIGAPRLTIKTPSACGSSRRVVKLPVRSQ